VHCYYKTRTADCQEKPASINLYLGEYWEMAMEFNEKVKVLRKRKELSQEEFGKLIGVKVRSVAYYESGGRYPEDEVFERIAKLFGVTVDFLKDDAQSVEYTKEELFIMEAKDKYGCKGASEAKQAIDRVKGLMAGGDLDEGSKDAFFEVMQEIYFDSKERAKKYGARA
jgi:transcriptional regulator with XRE-family HTH domain